MRSKKLVSMVLSLALVASTALTGCGKTDGQESKDEKQTTNNGGDATAKDPISIEVYDVAANYQGMASGWFAQIVKDKFNIDMNIIAPQVSGDAAALYQTRCSSGNLGDIVLLDNADFLDCIKAGLIKDTTADIWNYPNLTGFKEQIEAFNKQIPDSDGKIYGIPSEMTNTSPTSYSQTSILSSPILPWDYYNELGCPEMKTSDDLLDVLGKMQEAHPTNKDGDPAYAISLWHDWDDTSIENVNQMTKWYGQEVNQSILLGTDGSMTPLTDDEGAYHKMLKFLFKANQKGLVDPDSGTQDWNTMLAKMKAKKVYLLWYNWGVNFYNTVDHTCNADGYMYAPVEDMNFYQTSDTYYGSGRLWGIGSQVDDAKYKRILEFLDWYASPESVEYQQAFIKDFTYKVRDDGTYERINETAVPNNDPVPAEYGGGGAQDGMNQLNQWIVSSISINPNTKEMYASFGWNSETSKEPSKLEQEWRAHFKANSALERMQNDKQVTIVPSANLVLDSDTTDIGLIRSQCKSAVCDCSWKMIYAADEAEFDSLWNEMKDKVNGLGWDQLVQFDTAKYQKVVDMRKAAQ